MTYLTTLAALVFAILGILHFAYTLHDWLKQPRYFRPRDGALVEAMRATHVALAPNGRDFWSALIGFHFSHSVGLLLFAVLIAVAAAYKIVWLMPVLAAVGALYAVLAWRFWFAIPMIASLAATGLLVAGWLLRPAGV